MAIDSTSPRSRRHVLMGALGALGAAAAGVATTASGVLAAGNDGAAIHVGDTIADARTQTTLANSANDHVVLYVASNGDLGHGNGTALYGWSAGGIAVQGSSSASSGVYGGSVQGYGVNGTSNVSYGVYGVSTSSVGVAGSSASNVGVDGQSRSTLTAAVRGTSVADNTGVQGVSASAAGAPPPTPAKTGVYGYANQDAAAVGVKGQSPNGRGVVAAGGTAPLRLLPSTASSHPTAGARGDLFVDNSGRLWFCTKSGTVALWKQVSFV